MILKRALRLQLWFHAKLNPLVSGLRDSSMLTSPSSPKLKVTAPRLGQRPLCALPVVYRLWASVRLAHIQDWFYSWVPDSVFSAGKGLSSVDAWYSATIDIEEVLSNTRQGDVHTFVADVVKSFDTVDRDILDCALGRLGLPAWFRRVYFSFHREVWLRYTLDAGLGVAWTRDGSIPKDAPSDNLECTSHNVDTLLAAARYTVSCVKVVGREASPCKCVLLSTSRAAPAHDGLAK